MVPVVESPSNELYPTDGSPSLVKEWRNKVKLRTDNRKRTKINDNSVFLGSISPKRWRSKYDTAEIAAIL